MGPRRPTATGQRGHASAVSTRPDPSPETQTFSSTEASTLSSAARCQERARVWGGGRSNGAQANKYRGDLRSAPTRPPPGPVAGRPSRPLYDDTGPFCPPIALGRAPRGGGSAAWAGGTIGASLAHGDLLNTCLGWPGTVGRPYSAAGLGSGGAPRPCGAAPRGDPSNQAAVCRPVRHYRGDLALPGGGPEGIGHRGWRGPPL